MWVQESSEHYDSHRAGSKKGSAPEGRLSQILPTKPNCLVERGRNTITTMGGEIDARTLSPQATVGVQGILTHQVPMAVDRLSIVEIKNPVQ